MWRSVALTAGLAVALAGCAWGANEGASTVGSQTIGVVQGRVFTTVCGGLAGKSHCPPTAYRGELVFCEREGQQGICPAVRVDANGRYRIELRPRQYYLVPASGKHNVVIVKPRWVRVIGGQTRTLNINGGSAEK